MGIEMVGGIVFEVAGVFVLSVGSFRSLPWDAVQIEGLQAKERL